MNEVFTLISLPLFTGIILFLFPERFRSAKSILAASICIITLLISVNIYISEPRVFNPGSETWYFQGSALLNKIFSSDQAYLAFNSDLLSKLIALCISIFAFLVILYSVVYNRYYPVRNFSAYFLITLGCAYGAALSDNLLLFLFFWGALGITLYKLMRATDECSSAAAKKTLILIGASDSIMIIGIAIIWKISGTLSMSQLSMPVRDIVSAISFFALITGSFTKAGAFPFHTWVPDFTENAPSSSSAYLPASLDKLLGIYFLARITTKIFILNEWISLFLLTIGVITIIGAVMMALVQHDYKRLLGFHAVSQAGYMIIGFSLGSSIGIAAGLFHLINNAIYKTGLFMSSGAVEYRTGKNSIDDLGGLSRSMPITFITSIVFAISISGVPPFNGFASKWMIYQGIIDFGNGPGLANKLWIIWLAATILGSALTLASFIKFIGGIFLGRQRNELAKIREVPVIMWLPSALLAIFCIFLGVGAIKIVLPMVLMPVSGKFALIGFWNPSVVSVLILVSIALGLLVYLLTDLRAFRKEDSFIGGEIIQDQTSYSTPEFYKTILEFRILSSMFKKAEEKWFDIYDQSKRFVLRVSHIFSEAHTGVLSEYILWIFAGLIIMLLIIL